MWLKVKKKLKLNFQGCNLKTGNTKATVNILSKDQLSHIQAFLMRVFSRQIILLLLKMFTKITTLNNFCVQILNLMTNFIYECGFRFICPFPEVSLPSIQIFPHSLFFQVISFSVYNRYSPPALTCLQKLSPFPWLLVHLILIQGKVCDLDP